MDSRNLEETELGWPWEAVDVPQEQGPEAERKYVYDATYWSQENTGHPFGDHLTATERRAVIEYLKTLQASVDSTGRIPPGLSPFAADGRDARSWQGDSPLSRLWGALVRRARGE